MGGAHLGAIAATCLAGLAGLAACDPSGDGQARVPADHPCPEYAWPPETSTLGDDETIAPIALQLPTPLGLEVHITQGNDGAFSHFGDERFAWDFGVELGTEVRAAAAGVVVWIRDDSTSFGTTPDFKEDANFAVLDHGGGLFTSYVHLAADSARVAIGDVVDAGEVLATTGLSGQMTGPHLHFQVENVWSESLPARFAEPDGCDLLPALDDTVRAWEGPLVASHRLSQMPADAFVEDGVDELVGLPGRLFERAEHPPISGRATASGAVEVWLLVLPAVGGDALFAQRFAVVAGRFSGTLDLRDLDPGQYGLALVAGDGGSVHVPRSIRAAIVD